MYMTMKPSNKNRMLGTPGDFEFVVEYASMTSLDAISEISQRMVKNEHMNNPIQFP